MLIDELSTVVSHTDIGGGYRFMVMQAPRLAEVLTPGQFIHIRVPGLEPSALRRPISVFDAEDSKVTILYKQVGRGTFELAKVQEGAKIQVLGPLGHGFPVDGSGVPLLVGGGFGVAPLHFLAKRIIARNDGRRPMLFVGGRTEKDLLAIDRFEELGVAVNIATNDGSVGMKGFVTGPLDEVLGGYKMYGTEFELFTCGPDGLLKAVADRAVEAGMPGWISMDRHMVCGVGACFACIQKVKYDGKIYNARCCVNGPVFEAKDIVWN